MRGENGTESVEHADAAVGVAAGRFKGANKKMRPTRGAGKTPEPRRQFGQFSTRKTAEPSYKQQTGGETAELLLGRARLAGRRGNREKSFALFRAAAQLRPQDWEFQFEIAHALKRLGYLKEAADRCRYVLERKPEHARASQMLATLTPEHPRSRAQPEVAAGSSSDIAAKFDKIIKKVRKFRKTGQRVMAEMHCRQILQAAPDHLEASIELALLLRHQEANEAALAQLEIARIKHPDNIELLLQLAVILRDLRRYDESSAAFQKILDREPGNVPALHGMAKLALRLGDWPKALDKFESLYVIKPDDVGILVDIATVQFEMLQYEDAEATLQRAEAASQAPDDERYRSRKFHYFCVTGQWDRAQECLVYWPDHRSVPRGALSDVVRFYAERDRWNDVVDFLRDRFVEGSEAGVPRNGETFLSALAGGIRHTGRYAEALQMLEKWPGEDSLAVQNLREQIAEELALLDTVGLADAAETHEISGNVTSPVRAERRARMSRAFSRNSEAVSTTQSPAPDTIYFCADAKYILGAAVSLFSLLRHNPGPARNCAFVVYCPPGLLDFAVMTFDRIGASLGARVEVRSSATLHDENLAFRTKWGAFTMGRGLSIAAYYRIFAAIQLLGENPSGRALYIDADTCVGPGIESLLRFDLNGQPVAVRREDPLGPGVMRACSKLGISRGDYFNSGVLLFDLAHTGLEPALKQSIAFALNKQHLLTMVDQCALNIGFVNQAASLPPEFNFFVRDDETIELPSQPPAVIHYTAHPKPWDPSYQARHCLRWWDEFEALGKVLAPEHMKQLFAFSFPQRYGSWHGKPAISPASPLPNGDIHVAPISEPCATALAG
ncbi:MAG TPA: glycosyltransferase [Rhizomicrobium sp.]|jgi:UDP-glucose:(glucosyl)LPS alpha-1,3-glucosyltransferase/UDP-glucose:(galactosyl)LPS alpha-1,2-glucosyltransferase